MKLIPQLIFGIRPPQQRTMFHALPRTMLHGLLFALSFIAGGCAVSVEALLRSKIDAATLTWQIGMDEEQVEAQIGKPCYVTLATLP
jgi:hypothetical protein